MTEFGKTPLYNEKQLQEFGYNIAIYPVTSLRLSNKAIEKGYARLKKEGGNASSWKICKRVKSYTNFCDTQITSTLTKISIISKYRRQRSQKWPKTLKKRRI